MLRASRRFVHPRNSSIQKEELQVAAAIKKIDASATSVVLEVEDARMIGAPVKKIARRWTNRAHVHISAVTHADHLDDRVLWRQLQLLETLSPGRPIYALNLTNVDDVRAKEIKSMHRGILAAIDHMQTDRAYVVGCPNSGKSSLIRSMSRNATRQTKNKRDYHFPKVSTVAGRTLGVKSHCFQVEPRRFLMDIPGLRPRLHDMDPEETEFLVACGNLHMQSEMRAWMSEDSIARHCLRALHRYAEIAGSEQEPQYVRELGLDAPISNPLDFLAAQKESNAELARMKPEKENAKYITLMHLLQRCRDGGLGGMLFSSKKLDSLVSQDLKAQGPRFNRDSPLLWMNEAAGQLLKGEVRVRP